MELRVRRDDSPGLEDAVAALEVGGDPARLAHEEHAGGEIPRLQLHLPEAVEATAGEVREVDRGAAQAPDGARPGQVGATSSVAEAVSQIGVAMPLVIGVLADKASLTVGMLLYLVVAVVFVVSTHRTR